MRKLQSLIKSIFPLATLVLLAGCQIQDIDIKTAEEQNRELREVTITADIGEGAEAVDPATRTSVIFTGTQMKTHWTPGDRIKVFSLGESTMFTSTNSEPSRKAQFSGMVSMIVGDDGESGINYLWGLYPYREDATYSEPDGEGQSATAVITTTIPDMQKGKADSFEEDLATMLGRSESLTISYKNAYSGVYVKFNKSDVISVTLKGIHGETLAGRATFGLDENMNPVVVGEVQNPKTAVTVYAPDGGTFEAGKNYFMVTLPDVALEEGYSLTVKRQGGVEATFKSLTTVKSLDRNVFKTFNNPLDTYIENATNISNGRSTGWISSTTSSTQGINEIWYTTTDNSAVSYTTKAATGNEIAENIAPSDNNGVGIIRFKAPLTVIDPSAFISPGNTILKTVTLPETVETIGSAAFQDCSNLRSISFGSSLKTIEFSAFTRCGFTEVTLPEGLESLGHEAFAQNSSLERVTLPESLTTIEAAPFHSCPKLKEFLGAHASSDHRCLIQDDDPGNVTLLAFATGELNQSDTYIIPEGIHTIGTYAFASSTFGGIVLPESLREIQEMAFYRCLSLKNVTIPAAVESIQRVAFLLCNSLEWVKINNDSDVIRANWESEEGAFEDTNDCPIYVPSNLLKYYKNGRYWDDYESRFFKTQDDNEIFYTTSDNQPISYNAYYADESGNVVDTENCVAPALNGGVGIIRFEEPLTIVDMNAFYNRTTLTSVILPQTVTSISLNAFAECSSLTSIVLPEGLQTLEYYAFDDCESLETINIPESLEWIGTDSFNRNPFSGCVNLKKFTGTSPFISADGRCLIGNTGANKTLLSFATGGLGENSTYVIPDDVRKIGIDAFDGATVGHVVLPTTLNALQDQAFINCSNLKDITVPGNITWFGSRVFKNCVSLKTVYLNYTSVPTIHSHFGDDGHMFDNTASDLVIYVPSNLLATYKTAQYWSDYSSRYKAEQLAYSIWYTTTDGAAANINIPSDSEDLYAHIEPNDNLNNPGVGVVSATDGVLPAVPANLFKDCSNLKTVYIPKNVTKIEENAFSGCVNLETVYLKNPSKLKTIGNSAFLNCFSIQTIGQIFGSIDLPSVTSVGNHAFNHLKLIEEVNLPEMVTAGESAFYCLGEDVLLKSVNVPKLQTVGYGVFGYISLDHLNLPAATELDYGAFYYAKIGTLRLGANLNKVSEFSFLNAGEASWNIYFENDTPPVPYDGLTPGECGIWKNSFSTNISGTQILPISTIHVPSGSKEAYKAVFHTINSAYAIFDLILIDDL